MIEIFVKKTKAVRPNGNLHYTPGGCQCGINVMTTEDMEQLTHDEISPIMGESSLVTTRYTLF